MTAPIYAITAGDAAGARVAALLLGIAFGWLLERGGLGDRRVLTGALDGRDFTMVKVMLTAIATASLGIFWLGRAGMLDVGALHVPPTFLVPQVAGGLVFGAGFALAGLCPGTACVAAAAGRRDGLAALAGLFAGVLLFGEVFPWLAALYERTPRGALTIADTLGISYGAALFLLVMTTITALALIARHERARRDRLRIVRQGEAAA